MPVNAGQMYASLGLRLTGIAQAQAGFMKAMNNMGKQVTDVQKRLTVLEQQARRTGKAMEDSVKTVAPAVQTATKSIDQMGSSIFQSAQRWRTFGYLFSIVVTAPMVAAGKQAIDTAKDFDFAMAKIVGLVGLSTQAVAGLRKEILKVAPALAQTPQALAEASYFVTSAGFKDTAQALNIVEIAAKGATAGLGETSDVAKLLVFSMNAYRQSGLTAERAADVFTAAVREGAIEAEGFAGAMQSVLPIASALGVKIEEVAGTMAAMSLQGASAQNAAVYLKGVLNALLKLKPGSGGGKELEEMGVSVEGLVAKLREPGGLMKVLIQLKDLAKDVGGVPFLKTVFRDIRAMTGDLSLMGDNFAYNEQVIKAVTNASGDLTRAFDAQSGQIKKRMDSLKATMDVIKIGFGEALAKVIVPALEKLVGFLNRLITGFNNMSDGAQSVIIKLLGLVAAIGPLALLGSVIKYAWGGAFVVLTKGLQKLLVSMGALKIVTEGTTTSMFLFGKATKSVWSVLGIALSNPYVLIVAGAIAAGAAIISMIRKHNEFKRVQKDIAEQNAYESGVMSQLFERAMDTNRSLEQRKKTIEEINGKYGEYLKNLLSEKSSMKEIGDAYLYAEKAQRISMGLKMNQEELSIKQQDTAKAFKTGFKGEWFNKGDLLPTITKQQPDMLGEFYNDVFNLAEEAIKKGNGKIDWFFLQSQKVGLAEKYIKSLSVSKDKAIRLTEELYNGIDKVARKKVKEFEWQKQVDILTEALDKLNTSAKNVNETLGGFTVPTLSELPKAPSAKLNDDLWGSLNTGKEKSKILSPVDDLKVMFVEINKVLKDGEQKVKDFFTGKGYTFDVNKEMDQLILSTQVAAKEIEIEDAVAKRNGFTFNKNAKLIELYTKTVNDLRTGLGATNPVFIYFAKLLTQAENAEKAVKEETKELTDHLKDLKKFFDDFKSGLASIDMQKFILGPEFDVNSARLDFYKKSVEEYIKLLTTADPKTGTILTPTQEQMNRLKDMQMNVELYGKAIQDAIDRESMALLNAEATAFGNVAGKVEVLNFELQASEKYLRDMLKKRYSGKFVDPDEIKRTVQRIQRVKMALVDLENAQNIQYLNDMNKGFFDLQTNTALLEGHISALENKLRVLSEMGKGNTYQFKVLSEQLRVLQYTKVGVEYLGDAINQVFDTIVDGGDKTKTVWENVMDTLDSIFKTLIKDIIHLIVKTMLLRAVMGTLKLGNVDMAKELEDSVAAGLASLNKGLEKVDWSSAFKKRKIGELVDTNNKIAPGFLKESIAEKASTKSNDVAGLFGNISGKNFPNPDELIPNTALIDASSKKMKELTEITGQYGQALKTSSAIEQVGIQALEAGTSAKQTAQTATQGLAVAQQVQTKAKQVQVITETAALPIEKAMTAGEAASIPITKAKTAADVEQAGASILKSAASLPFPLAILAIGAGVGVLLAGIAAVIKATKMKEGGVVPSGYPNDTYHALLTSGEIVLPEDAIKKLLAGENSEDVLKKLPKVPKLIKGGIIPQGYPGDSFPALLSSGEKVIPLHNVEKETAVLEGEVRFEIGQDKLIGILRKGNKKNKIY